MKSIKILLTLLLTLMFSTSIQAEMPVQEKSLLGVVTYKEGLASALAHNHFVTALSFQSEGAMDFGNLATSKLSITIPVNSLIVDAEDSFKTWLPLLKDLNILNEPSSLSANERKDVRDNMLSKDQLDESKYPVVTGALYNLVKMSDKQIAARFDLVIRDIKVSRDVVLKLETKDDTVLLVSERYNFSDFKIEAYSAMLGAIRVKNEFTLIARLVFPAGRIGKGENP